jgi:hypothetical protein
LRRRAPRRGAARAAPGNHFLITFKTDHPGVTMPDYLRERYPDTISVMLQYEFWNLEVEDDHFSVSLSFSEVREHLTIPFLAVTAFVDPFAKFQLKFEAQMESDAATLHKRDKQPAHLKPAESSKAEAKDDAKDKSKSGEVVTLDAFRKK